MWPRPSLCGRRLIVLLLLAQHHHLMVSQAAAVAQLKNQQHHQHQPATILGQQPQTQQQRHSEPSQLPLQHQQPKQPTVTTHPDGTSASITGHHHLGPATASSSSTSSSFSSSSAALSSSSTAHLPSAQFASDKEGAAATAVQDVFKNFNAEDDFGDTYQILTDLKRETNQNSEQSPPPPPPPSSPNFTPHPSSNSGYPWNLFERTAFAPAPFGSMPVPPIAGIFPHMFGAFDGYPTPFPVTPRFMPIMSYPQPVLVPYPFYMAPEIFYPGFSALPNGLQDYEESMSRGAARRPAPSQHAAGYSRNSPIYYVRLPPTPYMFMPSLGLGATAPAMSGFPTMLPFQSLPSFPPFSSVFNVPINFLANGKPSNIYQMGGSPNDLQGPLQYPINNRPPAAATPPVASSFNSGYRPPSSSSQQYFNGPSSNGYGSFTSSASSSSTPAASLQDSKLTSLKRPYYFNGRPDDIYILPNNFNNLYSSENSYY